MDEPGVGGCGRSVAIGLYRCLVTEERRGGRLLNARRAKPARWVNARGRHRAVFYSLAFPVQRTPSRILRGHALKIITDGRVEKERESILGGSSDSRHSIPFTPSSRLALAYIRFDYASRRFSPRGCALSTVHCHRNRDLDCSRGVLKIVERLVLHIMASSRSISVLVLRGNSRKYACGNLVILHRKQGFVVARGWLHRLQIRSRCDVITCCSAARSVNKDYIAFTYRSYDSTFSLLLNDISRRGFLDKANI